jgi:hypothetical protein
VTTTSLQSTEIYPNILVYKNMFKDISKSYKVLTDSLLETEDRFFSPWTRWSNFGEYLNPITANFVTSKEYGNLKNIKTTSNIQEKEKQFAIEMVENFYLCTEDYIKKHNIDIDLNATSTSKSGKTIKTWRWTGGTIGKYHISNQDSQFGMRYHSDYQREAADAPGYKFIIPSTIYFNDDYADGEIHFVIGNKLIKYKPEAGDILVFPSGHPELLSDNGKYIHGVKTVKNKDKYLIRTFYQKPFAGSKTWHENAAKYGEDVWKKNEKERVDREFAEYFKNKAKDF